MRETSETKKKWKIGDVFNCENCGNEKIVNNASNSNRYCSKKCAQEGSNGSKMPRLKKEKFNCAHCGVEKEVNRGNKSSTYCSRKCFYQSKTDKRPVLNCDNCGTEFKRAMGVTNSAIYVGCSRQFCSEKCFSEANSGKGSANYKFGTFMNEQGCIKISSGEHRGKLQHRHVMEQHLGRELKPYENVHHLDGVRDNNEIKNLELWRVRQPPGQRVSDLLAAAKEMIKEYEGEIVPEFIVEYKNNYKNLKAARK